MLSLNRDKLIQAINMNWKNKNCPMCSENNWNVDTRMVSPVRLSDKGGIELGGQIMPLVAITCMTCGNTLFVNPLVVDSLENTSDDKN